jgi:hypothetical protein
LFSLININRIPFKFVADFKLDLVVLGMQTATATYPCPFCFVTLDVMRSGDYGNQILDENCQLSVSEECLRESFNLYEKGGCHKKDARNFHNTVSLPLLEESDETLVRKGNHP